MSKKISSSYYEQIPEKIWKAGRELERAEESIKMAKYHLERVVQNEYASEPIMVRAKALLSVLSVAKSDE